MASTGPAQGHYFVDPKTGELTRVRQRLRASPAPRLLHPVRQDDLVNEGGIMDLWVREARLFKYGSGTGSNFSKLRGEGETLSGGGRSSGLMCFLKIGDRAAGAIKSGGTTRRAAKMVTVDIDHPDIEALHRLEGARKSRRSPPGRRLEARRASTSTLIMKACHGPPRSARRRRFDPKENPALKREIQAARRAMISENYIQRVIQFAEQGYTEIDFRDLRHRLGLRSLLTVSGQNSNNSVRVPNDFLRRAGGRRLGADAPHRRQGRRRPLKARDLWDQIGYAAWACADPGLQFDTTINEWHTCPASGRINASNPCSEYMFLDDTACNLASLNLMQFRRERRRRSTSPAYEHASGCGRSCSKSRC